jgi:hypothetical protein
MSPVIEKILSNDDSNRHDGWYNWDNDYALGGNNMVGHNIIFSMSDTVTYEFYQNLGKYFTSFEIITNGSHIYIDANDEDYTLVSLMLDFRSE